MGQLGWFGTFMAVFSGIGQLKTFATIWYVLEIWEQSRHFGKGRDSLGPFGTARKGLGQFGTVPGQFQKG